MLAAIKHIKVDTDVPWASHFGLVSTLWKQMHRFKTVELVRPDLPKLIKEYGEGKLEENLILACDNQTSEFYKLTGYGAMMDLDIIAVDNKEVNFKENPFETVYFENTNPTSENMRTIRVRNSSPILVPFHWSVYK